MTLLPASPALVENHSAVTPRSASFARRLLRKPVAVVCVIFLLVVVIVAVCAPILLPNVATQNAGDVEAIRLGPSWHHLLGTDTLGRDVLHRILVGTRVTVIGILEAVVVAVLVGVPSGLAAGYLGGWCDRVIGWITDLAFALPGIVLILVVLSVFPQSMTAAMLTFGVLAAPSMTRIVRSATLPVREELYIAAARVSGLSRTAIVRRHVLPRVIGPVIVQASLLAASALLVQSGLAFLNLVVSPPHPSWGGMVAEGLSVINLQPWLVWPSGVMIALTVLALGLLGDAIRDVTAEVWSPGTKGTFLSQRTVRSRDRRTRPGDQARPRSDALLVVEGLTVQIDGEAGPVTILEDVSFDVAPGEIVGIVGESGCGKTMTAMSVLGLLPSAAHVEGGHMWFGDVDLATSSERSFRAIRGSEIALISQEPMVSLDPVFTVGSQLVEALRLHQKISRKDAHVRAIELLHKVRLPNAQAVFDRYPHELSGGMAQRVAIARALTGGPRLLIADEPTTALDVTVQAEILDLLRELQRDLGMGLVLVTHDWGVVADLCDRAVVMYAGHVVERASIDTIFESPSHPYSRALLASNPQLSVGAGPLPTITGTVPPPGSWPSGCHFAPRCQFARPECSMGELALESVGPRHDVRCVRHAELESI